MRLFIRLTREEFDRLARLAQAERRDPRDQAAVLVVQSLASSMPPRPLTDSTPDEPGWLSEGAGTVAPVGARP